MAHQVVAGIASKLGEVTGEPGVELFEALFDEIELFPGQSDVQARRGHLAEFQHPLALAVRDPEDGADDGDGQLGAVPVDDIHLTAPHGELVEQAVGLLLDHLAHPGHRPGGEDGGHELAVASVFGWFHRQQRRRLERVQRLGSGLALDVAQRGGEGTTELGDAEVVGSQ